MESELAKGREHLTVHSSNQAQFCESGSHRRWDSTFVFGRIRVEIGWSFASRKISPTLECPPGNRLRYNKLQIKRKPTPQDAIGAAEDRKSTRLNSSHQIISYAVFFLKKQIIN